MVDKYTGHSFWIRTGNVSNSAYNKLLSGPNPEGMLSTSTRKTAKNTNAFAETTSM